jgi:phospholipid-transporting ATPase
MHKRANFVRTAHAFADSETLQHQRFLNPSNRLKTTKYNFASFLPIVIFQQFTKVVTLFFLANGILNAVPSISLNSPLAVLIPLAFVVCLGIIKEAIVEVKRWQEDRVFNSTTTCKIVRSESNFTNCKKRLDEIVVGDVIEVADDE